jgi:hypothetical protein
MFKPGGYAFSFDPVGTRQEMDTATCFHCNTVVHIKPFMDPADMGGLCKQCMKFICPSCVGGGCTPFEKKLEAVEVRDRALRSYGM